MHTSNHYNTPLKYLTILSISLQKSWKKKSTIYSFQLQGCHWLSYGLTAQSFSISWGHALGEALGPGVETMVPANKKGGTRSHIMQVTRPPQSSEDPHTYSQPNTLVLQAPQLSPARGLPLLSGPVMKHV